MVPPMVFPPWRQTFLPPREGAARARTTHNLHRCVETQQQPNQFAPPKPNHETKPRFLEKKEEKVWRSLETILRFRARHLFGPGQAWKGREEREGSSSAALSVCGYILKFIYDTI